MRFAFLLSMPAIVGAAVFELPDALAAGWSNALLLPCAVGFAAAMASGLLAIRLVRTLMRRNSFYWFSVYCAAVGLITVLLNIL